MTETAAQTPFSTYRRILSESLLKLDSLVKDHKKFGLEGTETRLTAQALLDLARTNQNHLDVVQAHLQRMSGA